MSSQRPEPDRWQPGHLINPHTPCPKCHQTDQLEVRQYDLIWRDGEVWCKRCGCYVRTYDAG